MQVQTIAATKDITKTYSKTFDESDYAHVFCWFDRVEQQRKKLTSTVFKHGEKLYSAKYKEINLSKRYNDDATNTMTVMVRKIKFVWTYQELR